MPSPQEARIIGPSQADISRAGTIFKEVVSGRRLLARSHGLPRWTYPLLVAGSTLLAIACGTPKVAEPTPKAAVSITTEVTPPAAAGASPSPEPPRPTATAEPARATATAAPVGGPEAINLGNEALNRIADDLANNRPVAESDIIRFNAALEEKRKADEAAQAATKPAATPAAPAETPAPPTQETATELNKCVIIQEPELCAKAERIEKLSARGDLIIYIGLRVPPGTKIFSPIDGQVAKVQISQGASLKGFEASIDDLKADSTSFSIVGDLIFPNNLSLNEKQGAIIGEVGDRSIENFGGFNVVIRAGRYDSTKGYAVSDLDTLKALFPNAFKGSAKSVENQVAAKQYFGGNVYLDKK